MKKIILASASPRRKEILSKTGLRFRIDESAYEEDNERGIEPKLLAIHHAEGKARDVAVRYIDAIVISADTIVVLDGKVFGKPRDERDAFRMLRTLSNRAHVVITAFTVIDTATGLEISKAVSTKVFFKKLTDREIAAYIASGEPMDKAGAYGVQGLGASIVRRIEGDFFNVMGLPLSSLVEVLKKFGIAVLA